MPTLNLYEERLVRVLAKARRELTTAQVAKFSQISYNTTRQYLDILVEKKIICKQVRGNKIIWSV